MSGLDPKTIVSPDVRGRQRTAALTGGAGFVGAALARAWLDRGWRVRILDVDAGTRLGDLSAHPSLEIRQGDVRDPQQVMELVRGADLVVHLAAVVGVHRYLTDPDLVLDVNIGGTRCVVRACEQAEVPLLFTSTSEVYGSLPVRLREDGPVQYGDLANARWSYALSKAAGEQLVHAAGRRGLATTIVRFFNVYGPLMDAPGQGRVISTMIGAVKHGTPLALLECGHAVRSFCYIDDAVEAVHRLADDLLGSGPGSGKAKGLAVNVGRDEPVTMRELAQRIAYWTGHTEGMVDVPGTQHFGNGFEEVPNRVPDLTRLQKTTGFVAGISLDEGLRRTLAHWDLLRRAATSEHTRSIRVPQARPDVRADGALAQRLAHIVAGPRLSNHGPEVRALERELASALGFAHATSASSGFGALVLALRWVRYRWNLPSGTRAILPSFTYVATRNAVQAAGLVAQYCDIDADSWTLSPAALQDLLTSDDTRAVIVPVTVFGVPPRMGDIASIAARQGCPVVLDHAHGLGVVGHGLWSPHPADAVAISLHATKLVSAGEGGAVLTSDSVASAWMSQLSNHGIRPGTADLEDLLNQGFNFKLSELHAAVARHSLARLDERLGTRRAAAARLREVLLRAGWRRQQVPEQVVSNSQNVVALWPGDPGELQSLLDRARAQGVELRRYFYPPLHRLTPRSGDNVHLPVTDYVADRAISLPLSDALTEGEIEAIARAIGHPPQREHHAICSAAAIERYRSTVQ